MLTPHGLLLIQNEKKIVFYFTCEIRLSEAFPFFTQRTETP